MWAISPFQQVSERTWNKSCFSPTIILWPYTVSLLLQNQFCCQQLGYFNKSECRITEDNIKRKSCSGKIRFDVVKSPHSLGISWLTTQLLDIILLDEVKLWTLQIFHHGQRQNSKFYPFFYRTGVVSMLLKIIWYQLFQGRFKLNTRENSFTRRVVKHWNRLSREVGESSAPVIFYRCVDVTFKDAI